MRANEKFKRKFHLKARKSWRILLASLPRIGLGGRICKFPLERAGQGLLGPQAQLPVARRGSSGSSVIYRLSIPPYAPGGDLSFNISGCPTVFQLQYILLIFHIFLFNILWSLQPLIWTSQIHLNDEVIFWFRNDFRNLGYAYPRGSLLFLILSQILTSSPSDFHCHVPGPWKHPLRGCRSLSWMPQLVHQSPLLPSDPFSTQQPEFFKCMDDITVLPAKSPHRTQKKPAVSYILLGPDLGRPLTPHPCPHFAP